MTTKELGEKISNRLTEAIQKSFGEKIENFEMSFPPDPKFGDFSIECFSLSKKIKKAPVEIAKIIASKIESDGIVEKAENQGPYVNLKLTNAALMSVLYEVIDKKENFGNWKIGMGEKIMVEFLGPNTNKPIHLGHLRNGSIGMAISNILEKTGHKVLKANIINDRGIHISKSMLAYQKWGENSTPESFRMKGDHFVGHWYVKYHKELEKNPKLEEEAQEMLRKWESEDKEIKNLWKKMNEWVYAGWEETFGKLGFEFNVVDYESKNYELGKNVIEKGLKKGIFKKEESGSITFNLPENDFGLDRDGSAKKITLIRSDGTSVYITQDIGTAISRFEKHNLTRLIYIVGSEQEYHFRCLFKILEDLSFKWAKKLTHLSYGMIALPEGKMKSREGTVVDSDDLILEMKNLAREELEKRYSQKKIEISDFEERARKISLGAIKFHFLRIGASQDIEFNPKESISFDGFTGPYCQYTYARIASILRKSGKTKFKDIDFGVLGENLEEREIAKKIIEFKGEIRKSALEYNPSIIANGVFEIAQLFNKFYQKHQVLNAKNEETKKARLALVQAVQIVIKSGLNLLGIETLEKM